MIRLAEEKDFDCILDMAEIFWGHTQFSEPYDREHFLNMILIAYDHGLLIVADDGEICGFIAALKTPLICSKESFMATELAWWVNPEKRGKMYGVQLISALERLCIEQEVKYLNMVYMETSMPERVRDIYLSLNYSLQETTFTKVLYGSDRNRFGPGGARAL